jgi:hypothetical protein
MQVSSLLHWPVRPTKTLVPTDCTIWYYNPKIPQAPVQQASTDLSSHRGHWFAAVTMHICITEETVRVTIIFLLL